MALEPAFPDPNEGWDADEPNQEDIEWGFQMINVQAIYGPKVPKDGLRDEEDESASTILQEILIGCFEVSWEWVEKGCPKVEIDWLRRCTNEDFGGSRRETWG